MAMPDNRPADKGGPMPDDEPRPDRATLEGACAGRRFRFDGRPVRPPVVEALLTELLACGPDDTAVGLWVLEIPDDPGAARANVPAAVAGTLALRRCSQPA